MPMQFARITSTTTRAVVRPDFQATDSSVRTSMSVLKRPMIAMKMRYAPIFLANSNVYVVLATKEAVHIVMTMTNVQKMLIIVQLIRFAQTLQVVSHAHVTMDTMKRTSSVSKISMNASSIPMIVTITRSVTTPSDHTNVCASPDISAMKENAIRSTPVFKV